MPRDGWRVDSFVSYQVLSLPPTAKDRAEASRPFLLCWILSSNATRFWWVSPQRPVIPSSTAMQRWLPYFRLLQRQQSACWNQRQFECLSPITFYSTLSLRWQSIGRLWISLKNELQMTLFLSPLDHFVFVFYCHQNLDIDIYYYIFRNFNPRV